MKICEINLLLLNNIERKSEIERENVILLNKISKIMMAKKPWYPANSPN